MPHHSPIFSSYSLIFNSSLFLLISHLLQHFLISFTFWSSHSSLPYRYSFSTHWSSFYFDSSYPIFFTLNKLLSLIWSIFLTQDMITLSLSLSEVFFFFFSFCWVYNSFFCLHRRVMFFFFFNYSPIKKCDNSLSLSLWFACGCVYFFGGFFIQSCIST